MLQITSLECKTSYKKDTSDQMLAISEKQDINNSNSTMDAYENEIRSLKQEINDVHRVNDNLCRQLEEVNQNNEMQNTKINMYCNADFHINRRNANTIQ